MSRLRILLLLTAVAGLATVLVACGGGGGGSDEDPQAVLQDATFEGIENADLDLQLGVDVSGDEGGSVDLSLSGPFQSRGEEQLPELDLTAEASGSVNGEDVNFDGGLTMVPNKAFVSYEGTDYEVDPTTFSFIESAIEQAQEEGGAEGGTAGASACQEEAAGKFQLSDFIENLTNEGTSDEGGTTTTKVSGDLNVGSAIGAVSELMELPACESQLEAAGPLPLSELDQAQSQIESALKSAHAEVYVGEDKIVRRFVGEFEIEPEGSDESVSIEIDLTLDEVNQGQDISTPEGAKPLNDLFAKLGVNPLELLQGAQSGEGLGGLLEGLEGGSGSSSGGGSSSEAPGNPKAYLECVESAATAADIQNCSKKFQ